MAQTLAGLDGSLADDDAPARRALGWTPWAVAVCAILVAGFSGLHARGLIGTPIEPWVFGYFVERFPLAAALLVYAVVRLALLAVIPPGPSRLLRLFVLFPLALALVLGPMLYPTFGGLVVRAAYFTGGMSFLQGGPLPAAWPIGAIVSGSMLALFLGLAAWLARLRADIGWRSALAGLARLVAVWWAALVIALPTASGIALTGAWPIWPMTIVETLTAALLVGVALAPHAALVTRAGR